jgi:hypothetical protein
MRDFILIIQKIVLFGLAAIDDVLLELRLLQPHLLVLEVVVLLLPLVVAHDLLKLRSVGRSGGCYHLALRLTSLRATVHVTVEYAVY